MKQFFTKQFFLFLIGIMLCGTISAQTNYGIKIAGKNLTNLNATSINNDSFPNLEVTNGTITYDHSTKTITLNEVKVNVNSGYFILITEFAPTTEYKINLIGNNTINTGSSSIITFRNLIIEGNSSLKVISNDDCGIFVGSNRTLTINNTTVDVTGGSFGIAGENGKSGENLIIENSYVKATGNNDGSICNLQNITLNNCVIVQPEDAIIADNDTCGQAVMLNNSVVTSEVIIEPIRSYGIKIANKDLTNANARAINNVNFPNLVLTSGTITYNHNTKTFTLDGVNANVSSGNGNFLYITELAEEAKYKINLIGTNIINTSDASIRTYRNLSIEGTGSLIVEANIGIGIYVLDTITIKNTTVEAKGSSGIAGFKGKNGETLIIENSTVKAKGLAGSISYLENITLIDCKITEPENAVIANNGTDGQAVMISTYVVTSEVVIEPETGINNLEAKATFSIYPNPASNMLSIFSENANELITISDLSGKIVYAEQTSEKQTNINISHLNAGMYIVRIGNKTAKFVKE